MAPKVQTTKAAKAAAAMAGGKSRKKNTKRVKDKAQHHVILDQPLYDRVFKEAGASKFFTVSVMVDRLKVNGSLARRALKALEEEGIIKPVITHSKQKTYTRVAE